MRWDGIKKMSDRHGTRHRHDLPGAAGLRPAQLRPGADLAADRSSRLGQELRHAPAAGLRDGLAGQGHALHGDRQGRDTVPGLLPGHRAGPGPLDGMSEIFQTFTAA